MLEAEQKQRWVAEAVEVSFYTAGGVTMFCLLLFAGLRMNGRPTRHPLVFVNLVQIGLALVFLLAVVLLAA